MKRDMIKIKPLFILGKHVVLLERLTCEHIEKIVLRSIQPLFYFPH